MSIQTEITALETNLQSVKNAVESKGGTVGDTGLAGLATEVESIPSGGADPFELFGVNSLPVEPTEVDYKYAAMEWTFEPDVKYGDMGEICRSLKLDGEYVFDWVYHEAQEEWEQSYYSKTLKSKFSDITQINYVKPFTFNLNNWLDNASFGSISNIDWPNFIMYLDMDYVNPKVYPIISLPDFETAISRVPYNWYFSIGSLVGTYKIIKSADGYKNAYSNSDLCGGLTEFPPFYVEYDSKYQDPSTPWDIDTSAYQRISDKAYDLILEPEWYNKAIYLGLTDAKQIRVSRPSSAYDIRFCKVSLAGSSYPSLNKVIGVYAPNYDEEMENPGVLATKFPVLEGIKYGRASDSSSCLTFAANNVINLWIPNRTPTIGYFDFRYSMSGTSVDYAPAYAVILHGGGREGRVSADFEYAFNYSYVTSIDMSDLLLSCGYSLAIRYCPMLTTVRYPRIRNSSGFDSTNVFQGCPRLSTLDLSRVLSDGAIKIANNIHSSVPRNCAITVIDQDAADAFTAKGFTNVTVASA